LIDGTPSDKISLLPFRPIKGASFQKAIIMSNLESAGAGQRGVLARAVDAVRYVVSGITPETWFGPLQPLQPMAPSNVAGRQFDYPFGVNITTSPRADEALGFGALRALAENYDLLRLVIETRKDQVERCDWSIQPRAAGVSANDPRIAEITRFFRMPDREHTWSAWLRMLLEDLFVIDAPTLYVRRSLAGGLYGLEIVDGATIKRVLDADGRTPLPPDPAYQQILKGLPAVDYSRDELLYMPRNPRPHKIYGYGPVEQILMTVNIALRRQVTQLNYYTEGNTPEALIGVPAAWQPDQIDQFQRYWDSLLEGNLAARRHAKFVPGGLTYQPTREPALKDDMDEWLARVVCFAFSISPTPFVKQVNRATAEASQDAAQQEGLAPLLRWVKGLVDGAIVRFWGYTDLEFVWSDESSPDPLKQAQINQIYVGTGIKSVDEVRAEMGLSPAKPSAQKRGLTKFNPNHVPAGSPDGGQFTTTDGAGGGASDNAGSAATLAQVIPFPLELPNTMSIPDLGEGVDPLLDTVPDNEETPTDEECQAEWEQARANCEQLDSKGLLGKDGYRGFGNTINQCIRGQVSAACGGNPTGA